jgi:imidazole glycerol phosphate synthase glutamine amidotransferase subunit
MIGIIDYGAGNLGSVRKAFEFLGVSYRVIHSGCELEGESGLVLPGVGAFGAAMTKLENHGFIPIIRNYLEEDRPFLGICLGMQLLMQGSEESKGIYGLGIVKGNCHRFQSGKTPQIGWNQVEFKKKSQLFTGIPNLSFFYFLHSYYVAEKDQSYMAAHTNYYTTFTSVFQSGNLCAFQFHPEKSGEVGLKLLRNWINYYVRGKQNENS